MNGYVLQRITVPLIVIPRYQALHANHGGLYNTASGGRAFAANTSGNANTAHGFAVLRKNTTGANNTASGTNALFANTTGTNNIALGYRAGYNLTTGSGNIVIGHEGVAGDGSTMRLGTDQNRTFIAGIHGKVVSGGSAVVITSTGEVGTVVSSARYKEAIQAMGSQRAQLGQLRPVTFRYTADAQGATQYGLIAEEVAAVYPELVNRNEDGQVESVQYHQLIAILLQELQQHQQQIAALQEQNAHVRQELQHYQQHITALQGQNGHLQAALGQLEGLAARLERLETRHTPTLVQR